MNDIGIDFLPAARPASAGVCFTDNSPASAGVWPFPVQCVPKEDAENVLAEFCDIELTNGDKLSGKLISFNPKQRALNLLTDNSVIVEKLDFDRLFTLRLVRPVGIQRPQQRIAGEAGKPVGQPYTLTLCDGVSLTGVTIGSVEDEAGLYLFHPVSDDQVERRFHPHSALRSRQVGERLGDILLESNQVSRQDIETALMEQHQSRGKRLGEWLESNQFITREELAAALKRQESMPVMRLGEALLQMKYITQQQLDAALLQQRNDRKTPLGQILVNAGIIDERRLKKALAEKLGIPFIDLDSFAFEFDALSRLSEEVARKHTALPLFLEHGMLVVALNDPLNAAAIESLRFHSQLRIAPVMASKDAIIRCINRCYSPAVPPETWNVPSTDAKSPQPVSAANNAQEKGKTEELIAQLNQSSTQQVEINDPHVTESDNSLVKLVNKILIDAYLQQATDIHIENYPDRQDTCIRFRRDGALYDYLKIPYRFRNAIVSRVKIMSALDISEKRRPQDGKLEFSIPGEPKLEFRVATIPTVNGLEDIVLRLLSGATLRSLEHIGMEEQITNELRRLIAKPYGMILACGPTGSGKTTTLHSLLGEINTRERKIWTAEDPVEITHPGLRQVQVNSKIGWTFAATLRAFLRSDPDVIMVGEMRDLETARIAMEASLTGHLVLSTLHTNSAVDSVVRLLDMGLDPFNFADSLLCVIAQRLARKVCDACGVRETAGEEELQAMAEEYCVDSKLTCKRVIDQWKKRFGESIQLRRPRGCNECSQTGYRGRVGLYELFSIDQKARSLMQHRSGMDELSMAAKANGMATLKQYGIEKILAGHTDLKQVRAVCG